MSLTVQNIIDGTSQDMRLLLSSLTTPGQPILIDYTNRTQNQMLRRSRWAFILSNPQYFITELGQTDYWIGPNDARAQGTVLTGLNLQDVDKINLNSVRDMSNIRALKWMQEAPIGPILNYPDAQSRPGLPADFRQDPNTPNILSIYPAPNNQNTYQPVPETPVIDFTPGGSLPARMYFVNITLLDSLSQESSGAFTAATKYIPANNLAIVRSPQLLFGSAANGISYASYNVYAASAPNYVSNPNDPQTEALQNLSPISVGTDWVEPTSGLTTTGALVPQNNSIEPLGGYIIQFRYYKQRGQLASPDAFLVIPDTYKDIVIHGVNYLGWKLVGEENQAAASKQLYDAGIIEMIRDKNLFPTGVEFIRPDAGTYVNQQILGYLPPFF